MQPIQKTYVIKASIGKVWKALVDPEYIEKWGGGPSKMDDKLGTKFELWGGDIHGINKEVIEGKRLVQDWYGGDWPQASHLTFTLTEVDDKTTKLELLHENVPNAEVEEIDKGWDDDYLGAIKEFLEY